MKIWPSGLKSLCTPDIDESGLWSRFSLWMLQICRQVVALSGVPIAIQKFAASDFIASYSACRMQPNSSRGLTASIARDGSQMKEREFAAITS